MKLSIITCTRNSIAFLPDTVRSVQMQQDAEYEHIFVDGFSTDGTVEYLKGLPGNNIILEGIDGGIARAMNAGIKIATGDVIAHIHSDDYYLDPHVFNRVIGVFEQTNCQWLFGRIMSDIDGKLVPENYEIPKYSFKRFLRGNFIPHPATFIRRKVFDECGLFSETLRYAMDYDLFLRIAKNYEPEQMGTHLAAFRRHDGSTTQANFMKSFAEDFSVRRMYSSWYQLPEATLRYLIRRRRHLNRLQRNG